MLDTIISAVEFFGLGYAACSFVVGAMERGRLIREARKQEQRAITNQLAAYPPIPMEEVWDTADRVHEACTCMDDADLAEDEVDWPWSLGPEAAPDTTTDADRELVESHILYLEVQGLHEEWENGQPQNEPVTVPLVVDRKLTLPQLKALCKDRGLKVSGTKTQLIERLQAA